MALLKLLATTATRGGGGYFPLNIGIDNELDFLWHLLDY